MSERSLRYLKKSSFGGIRSRRGKRKPNQLYVCDTTTQWLDYPKGPHFNKLPVQLILEIFKYLSAYELLRKVSLVCKYWYNLCRDRTLWTSITWNGTQRTLGHLLQLTKYQVHELVLTNLCNFSGKALACLLKKCMHLKYLKLPKRACRELFERELPRTNIIVENQGAGYRFTTREENNRRRFYEYSRRRIRLDISRSFDNDLFMINPFGFCIRPKTRCLFDDSDSIRAHIYRCLFDDYQRSQTDSKCAFRFDADSIRAYIYEEEIDIALASLEHKRFLTHEEYIEKHIKAYFISQPLDIYYFMELERLQRHCDNRSTRRYEKTSNTTWHSCIRKIPFQDCRMDRRQHQPSKRKPRPPKGRINHHKDVRKFRRLQKRFKVFSLL